MHLISWKNMLELKVTDSFISTFLNIQEKKHQFGKNCDSGFSPTCWLGLKFDVWREAGGPQQSDRVHWIDEGPTFDLF